MQPEVQKTTGLTFKNPIKVAEWLRGQGYKVSQRKVYQDVEKGMLVPMPGGWFTEAAVTQYAKLANLKRPAAAGASHSKVVEALKLEEYRIAQLKREALQRAAEREKGNYIKRSDHYRNAAARAAVLDQGMQNFIRARVPDMISMVGGDQAKAMVAIDFMMNAWFELLTEYRDLKNVQFIVEG